MERNTVIALVLIILIWILWPKWMEMTSPGTEPVAPGAVPADTARALASRPDTLTAQSKAPVPIATDSARVRGVAVADTIPVRQYTINTDKYVAVLSNEGASLRKWQLKRYRTPAGFPVQLVAEGGRGVALAIGAEGKETDLRSRVFIADMPAQSAVLTGDDSLAVEFTCGLENGRRVYKRYVFHGDKYRVGLAAGFADSLDAERMVLSWDGAIPSTEGDFVRESSSMFVDAYVGGSLEKLQTLDKTETSTFTGQTDWVGVRNKYFLAAFAPTSTDRWDIKLSGTGIKDRSLRYGWKIAPFDLTKSTVGGFLYLGPLDVDELVAEGQNLERGADLGWAVLRPISKFFLWFFLSAYKYIPNYGWVIVVFSVLIKILLHPLTKKSYESTSKMQKLKPLMDEIREKYKNDQQRLNQEMVKLYKEQGFNPLGGCLPMLLQMPIIFAVYAVIGNNIEFRQAPFIWWIRDLSIPDSVYTLPFHVPLYGSHVTILPVLMAISMFFQQKLTITDPKQQMLVYMMPVIMLFVFNNLASGLVLYWFLFNILSSAHQYWLMKKQNGGELAPKPAAVQAKNVVRPRKH